MASSVFAIRRPLAAALGLLGAALVALLLWFALGRLEGTPPDLSVQPDVPAAVGPALELTVTAEDAQSGVRRLRVELTQAGRDIVLLEEPPPGAGRPEAGKASRVSRTVRLDPRAQGLADGPAVLRITAADASWRGWGGGNAAERRFELRIDTRPPRIENRGPQTAVAPGGSGLAVYRLSEPCPQSGVRVGEEFFPGRGGLFPEDPLVHAALFALPHDTPTTPGLVLEARDEAGNRTQVPLPVFFHKRSFRRDAIPVSEAFLRQVLAEFERLLPPDRAADPKEAFLWVNRDLRRENHRALTELTRTVRPEILWEGAFLRMPNAAPRAGFADRRTYLYEGRPIDEQDHLGVDLASTAQAAVPAANAGVVAFVGPLGIYGQTVLVDHGLGLFSMYGHLSAVAVSAGERVARGQTLGRTGSTGLAAGDHLHFSLIVHHRFVDPVEWWDPLWIQERVLRKLEAARRGEGAAPAAAPPKEGPGRPAAAKRPGRGR